MRPGRQTPLAPHAPRSGADSNPITTLVSLILVALGLSACFSLCETSLLSSRRHLLVARANKGQRGAKAALRLLDDMDSMLATLLLWNNFANVVVATLATVLAVRLIADSETVLSATSVLTTLAILIFAEITPKAIGVRFSESISCFAAPVLYLLVRAVPIGGLMRGLINIGRYAFRIKGEGKNPRRIVAVNEMLAFIQDKDTLSEVDAEQKAMLYRMVGLHELTMRDLMIARSEIEYIDLEDEVGEIENELYGCGKHNVPLCNDGLENVLGMLDVREALKQARAGRLSKAGLRRLADKPAFVPETIDPVRALRETVSLHQRPCLVVDEYGGLIGMVSVADYFRQVFGGQARNGDVNGRERKSTEITSVGGEELVREVNLQHSLQLPEEAKTVAGLFLERLGNFPEKVGARVFLGDIYLEIAELDDLRIKQVSIRRDAVED